MAILYKIQTNRSARLYESLTGKKIILESIAGGLNALKAIKDAGKDGRILKALEKIPLSTEDDFIKAVKKIAFQYRPGHSVRKFLEEASVEDKVKYFELLAEERPAEASIFLKEKLKEIPSAAEPAPSPASSPKPAPTPGEPDFVGPVDVEFTGPPVQASQKEQEIISLFNQNAPSPPPPELTPIIEKIDILLKEKQLTKENFDSTLAKIIKYPDLDKLPPKKLKIIPGKISLSDLTPEQLKQYQKIKEYFKKELLKQKIILATGSDLAKQVIAGKSKEAFVAFCKLYGDKIFLSGLFPIGGKGILPYRWRVILFASEMGYAFFTEFFGDIEKSAKYILDKISPDSKIQNSTTASKVAWVLGYVPHLLTLGGIIGWIGHKLFWHGETEPKSEPSTAEKIETGATELKGKAEKAIKGFIKGSAPPDDIKKALTSPKKHI